MSEKEKTILEKMAQLPPELQDKMAAQIDGAVKGHIRRLVLRRRKRGGIT